MRWCCTRGIPWDVTRDVFAHVFEEGCFRFYFRKGKVTMSRTFRTLGTCVVLAVVFVVAWVMMPPPKLAVADSCVLQCGQPYAHPDCNGTDSTCRGCYHQPGMGALGHCGTHVEYDNASGRDPEWGTGDVGQVRNPCKTTATCDVAFGTHLDRSCSSGDCTSLAQGQTCYECTTGGTTNWTIPFCTSESCP